MGACTLIASMHPHAKCLLYRSYCVCLFATKQGLKFEKNSFIETRDTGCAHTHDQSVHARTYQMSSSCVCLAVTKQDLKFEKNLFMENGVITAVHARSVRAEILEIFKIVDRQKHRHTPQYCL